MNYRGLVNEIEQNTGESKEVCSKIIDTYETYCEETSQLPFKKEVDYQMIDRISLLTGYSKQTTEKVVIELVSVVRNNIKNKSLFKS